MFQPEILIVIAVIAVLFGGSKIPQLARSLGSAKHEFERGSTGTATPTVVQPAAVAPAAPAAPVAAPVAVPTQPTS